MKQLASIGLFTAVFSYLWWRIPHDPITATTVAESGTTALMAPFIAVACILVVDVLEALFRKYRPTVEPKL